MRARPLGFLQEASLLCLVFYSSSTISWCLSVEQIILWGLVTVSHEESQQMGKNHAGRTSLIASIIGSQIPQALEDMQLNPQNWGGRTAFVQLLWTQSSQWSTILQKSPGCGCVYQPDSGLCLCPSLLSHACLHPDKPNSISTGCRGPGSATGWPNGACPWMMGSLKMQPSRAQGSTVHLNPDTWFLFSWLNVS